LDDLYDKGKISEDEYIKKYMHYDDLKEKVNSDHIHSKELNKAGIDTKHLSTNDKGFIDFAKSDESALKADMKAGLTFR